MVIDIKHSAARCVWSVAIMLWAGLLIAAEVADKHPVQNDYWQIEQVPTPKNVVFEVSALEWIPASPATPTGMLAVTTRRGDVWIATGVEGDLPNISWKRFAEGLHEPLGLAWRDAPGGGWLYVTQRGELSRLRDENGDGVADVVETVSDDWGLTGDPHEYSFGSKFDREGRVWIVHCLTASFYSEAPFRGWCMRVAEDGTMIPTCSGIRSPGGVGFDGDGEAYYTENQGPWNGSCALKHLVPGDFMGHPAGNKWYSQTPIMGPAPEEPKSGSRIAIEAKRIPQLRPPAIVFPYALMGQSAAGILYDSTAGQFGPFSGQLLVTDNSHSLVMRCSLETVHGMKQGACFPMLAGFRSGSLAEVFSPRGMLFVGGTNRGWGSRGPGEFALERVRWTGRTPFEIRAIHAVPGGFELEFTHTADPVTAADTRSYSARGFTYIYHSTYGSPVVDEEPCPIEKAELVAGGRRVRLTLGNVREGMVHEIRANGCRAAATADDAAGQPLLHDTGWYTLNRLP